MSILVWMLRRRRPKVAYLLGSLLLLSASLHAPTAYAAPGDPPTGSPAGSVYTLPLEQGRADGAPKGGGGTGAGNVGGGGSAPGETGSFYRSENNFGSSSHVPGLAAVGAGIAGGGGPGGPGGTGGPGPGAGAGGGTGAGGVAGAGAAIAGSAAAAHATDAGNTSISASVVLIAAIALLAAAVGVLSRRVPKRRAAGRAAS